MEKQTYIAPKITVLEVEPVEMLAVSRIGYTDDKASNDYEALTNEHRKEWGNLWN